MDTYKIGDAYKTTYPDAPVPPERQYKIGQELAIRDEEGRSLLAIYKVTATDDTNIEGEIVRVFKVKVPLKAPTVEPQADPRKSGPAPNRKVKPF